MVDGCLLTLNYGVAHLVKLFSVKTVFQGWETWLSFSWRLLPLFPEFPGIRLDLEQAFCTIALFPLSLPISLYFGSAS